MEGGIKTVFLWMTPIVGQDVHCDCSGIVEHDGVKTLTRSVLQSP
jgi:hypothetical protein